MEADEEVAALFENIGWGLFFRHFSGHNTEVTRQFALSLKENVAQIGGFKFIIDQYKIAEAQSFLRPKNIGLKEERLIRKGPGHYFYPYPLMQS